MKYSDSRTFKDLLHQIPKLSRPYSVFKDFPGPGKMTTFFSRTFKDFQGPVATLSIPYYFQGMSDCLLRKVLPDQQFNMLVT